MDVRRFKDYGLPSGVFYEELLLEAPQVGEVDAASAQIFIGQVSFLLGGLLLGMTISHMAIEGTGMFNIMNLLAEKFRELHEQDAGGKIAPPRFTPLDNDRILAQKVWERESGMASASQITWPIIYGCAPLSTWTQIIRAKTSQERSKEQQ